MKSLKNFFKFLVHSNIFVALSAGALTKITLLKFRSDSDVIPLLVVCLSVLAYNYIRINELKEERLQWYRKWFDRNRVLFIAINGFAAMGVLVLSILIPIQFTAVLALIPFVILTFFYVKPNRLKIDVKALRAIPFFKIFSIAISWAGVTVLFPMIQEFGALNKLMWVAFLQRFLFVIALTIPFDIRDVHIDSKSMQTIPQVIGVRWSKWMAILYLALVLLLENSYFDYWHFQTNKTLVLFAYLSVLILNTTPENSRYYTSFWVEGVPILWLLLILYF